MPRRYACHQRTRLFLFKRGGRSTRCARCSEHLRLVTAGVPLLHPFTPSPLHPFTPSPRRGEERGVWPGRPTLICPTFWRLVVSVDARCLTHASPPAACSSQRVCPRQVTTHDDKLEADSNRSRHRPAQVITHCSLLFVNCSLLITHCPLRTTQPPLTAFLRLICQGSRVSRCRRPGRRVCRGRGCAAVRPWPLR